MTELEAQAVEERLIRIWGWEDCDSMWDVKNKHFGFSGEITEGTRVSVNVDGTIPYYVVLRQNNAQLFCNRGRIDVSRVGTTNEASGLLVLFVAEWLLFFRRNCWLSGCPIEASAHEKVEWMQGVYGEEIESWNLKM